MMFSIAMLEWQNTQNWPAKILLFACWFYEYYWFNHRSADSIAPYHAIE